MFEPTSEANTSRTPGQDSPVPSVNSVNVETHDQREMWLPAMPEAGGSIRRNRPPVGEPVESVARESEGSSLVQARTFSPELHERK